MQQNAGSGATTNRAAATFKVRAFAGTGDSRVDGVASGAKPVTQGAATAPAQVREAQCKM